MNLHAIRVCAEQCSVNTHTHTQTHLRCQPITRSCLYLLFRCSESACIGLNRYNNIALCLPSSYEIYFYSGPFHPYTRFDSFTKSGWCTMCPFLQSIREFYKRNKLYIFHTFPFANYMVLYKHDILLHNDT